ncbi:MAG: cyclase [Chloroflexi bacterium]|nr:cyclase [Chloroflexota bacterium]
MPYLLVRHKVADFSNWKPIFDEHEPTRANAGSQGGLLFRSVDDPNEVFVLLEWDAQSRAREFAQSEDLRQAMDRAGVLGPPDVYFMDIVERLPA